MIIAWVPFRAETLDGTRRVLGAMIGWHGVALPRWGFDPIEAMAWLTALTAIALLAPNSQQWLRAHAPVLGAVDTPPGLRARLEWHPTLVGASSVGTLLLLGLWQLSGVSEFLYFQF